jgi:hypothetical protein
MDGTRRGMIAIGIAATAALLGGCVPSLAAPAAVRGSGHVVSESRPIANVQEVAVSGAATLLVQQTGVESLTIEAEDNILPLLTSEVRNGRLSLGLEMNTIIRPTRPIRYVLTVKELRALDLSGATKAEVEDLRTNDLRVGISGSGNVRLSGRADRQDVRISGSGDYIADLFESKETTLRSSGSSRASVRVSDRLIVAISGSGHVEYIGSPQISQTISGAGTVRKR